MARFRGLKALTTLVILPLTTLLALLLHAAPAPGEFRAVCSRTYSAEACECAAARILQALGRSTLAQAAAGRPVSTVAGIVAGDALTNPRTRATAIRVVQSCMPGGDDVAD